MKLVGIVGLLSLTLAFHPLYGDSERSGQAIQWLDDRGEPLPAEEVFEVCWIQGLKRDCDRVPGHSLPTRLPRFDVVQIDSMGHGPVSIRAQDLQPTDEGYRLQVPRKAWLTVKSLPGEVPLTLSLYPQHDPAAPRPVLRTGPLDDEVLRIPAGAFIASLSSKGSAPHLILLDIDPGEQVTIPYQRRSGWSLVLRASDQQTGSPVAGAQVEITPAPGYSRASSGGQKVLKANTSDFGLAVFSGLEEPIIEANLSHLPFLPVQVAGLSSTPGTFAFQDVLLPRGGSATVAILSEGKPVGGAECTLLRYTRDAPGSQAPPEKIFSATSDEEGLCQARRLREGTYWLRVRPPRRLMEDHGPSSAHVDRVLQIAEGQDSRQEVSLQPTRLEGTVRLGERPAREFEVVVQDPENRIKNSSSKDALVAARTDDDGHYEMTLWTTGQYWMFVYNKLGAPGAMKTVRIDGGTETVDFDLASEEITGRVIDGEGEPLENANVQLKWNRLSHRLATTDSNGDFAFPVEEDGQAELIAHKEGYASSEAVQVVVGPDLDLQPVVLTLTRRPEIVARLSTSGGDPVLNGWAAIYRLAVNEPVLVGTATPGADGSFRLPVVPGQAHRVFFAGPNCPLGARLIEPLPDPASPLELVCSPAPASLRITLETSEGAPREGLGVLLASGKVVYPREVVAAHLARLGLPATTNGSGHLSLVALEPGEYRLYLADVTSPFNVLVGAPNGFLTNATLTPWSTRAVEVRLEVELPADQEG